MNLFVDILTTSPFVISIGILFEGTPQLLPSADLPSPITPKSLTKNGTPMLRACSLLALDDTAVFSDEFSFT
eukprot:scaffold10387_cov216-Skeletonema_menzelii.AAC.3